MEKLTIFVIILVIILVAIMPLTISSKSNYIKVSEHTNSHTKAICTTKNFCQDYKIFCENQTIISMNSITGATVQFSKNWKDPRTSELKNSPC